MKHRSRTRPYKILNMIARERRAVRPVYTIAVRDSVTDPWRPYATAPAPHAIQEALPDAHAEFGVLNVQTVTSAPHMVAVAVEALNK